MANTPRDPNIGIAAVLPLSPADRGVIAWLKTIANNLAAGIAGTPAGGVQSVQGVSGGTAVSVTLPAAQDPIFDHTNGTKTSVSASTLILTPPTACLYTRISSDVDVFVNTAGNAAVDDGTSIRVFAGRENILPVTAAVALYALSSGDTATVRCTPFKVRA